MVNLGDRVVPHVELKSGLRMVSNNCFRSRPYDHFGC